MNAAPSLADALDLARAGWAVIPLHGKVPVTAHGVKDATTDARTITAWWAGGTAVHNIGARVPASFVVLDFDPQNGGTVAGLADVLGYDLPDTLTVHSGRGTGGQHRYYLHPGGPLSSTRLPAGIDVKTGTGYCVMPPSLHPATGNPYRWDPRTPVTLPGSLVALLRPPAARRPAAPARASAGRGRYLVAYVAQLGEGRRNAGLYWAACRAVEDGEPAATFDALLDAAVSAGLPDREAARTIASARRTPGGPA